MKRFVFVCAVVMAFFVFCAGPARAQEDSPAEVVFCGELDAADCAILAASPAAMAGLTSGESANVVEVAISPVTMPPSDPISVSLGLKGASVASSATIHRIAELAALALPTTVDTAQTARISLSPSLVDALAAWLDVELPSTLTFQSRFVDGVAYVHMADFAGLWPQATRFGEWISIDRSADTVEVTVYPAATPPSGPISVSVSLEGAFVAPPVTIERMAELGAMGQDAVMADPDLVAEALTLPLTIDRAQTARVSLSSGLVDALETRLRVKLPSTVSLHNRFVDGVIYVRMADFAGFWPQATRFGEWIGIDLMFIMPDIMARRAAAGEVTPDEVAEALVPPGARLPGAYIISVPPDQEEAYSRFVEIIALRDTVADGQPAAVYRIQWDLPAYLASPVATEHLYAATSGQVNVARLAPVILMATTALLHNLDNQVVQQIGLTNSYAYQRDTTVGWTVGGVRFGIRSLNANRNLNALPAIPAPENAFVPPLGLIWALIQAVQQR